LASTMYSINKSMKGEKYAFPKVRIETVEDKNGMSYKDIEIESVVVI